MTVQIDDPPAGNDVPGGGAFITKGYAIPGGVGTRAWVNDNGIIVKGVPIIPPPAPYHWAFQFQGVRKHVYVFLNVEATEPTGESGSGSIQVRCVP